MFGTFEILKIKILMIFFTFINMGPKRSKSFKVLVFLQVSAKGLQTCPDFSPNGAHKTTFLGIFEIFTVRFKQFFFQKFQIHHFTLWRSLKPQLFGK